MKTVGIVLVILGVLALAYGGLNYRRTRTVLQVGSVSVSATEHRSLPVAAVAGTALVIGGVALLVVGRRRSQPV